MPSLTLKQRQEIDLIKELLVEEAERLLDRGQVSQIERNKFGHSQLRNLAAVAAETESPAVVANFIRFQMGRDSKGESWSRRVGQGGGGAQPARLGQLFIDELTAEAGAVSKALKEVTGWAPGAPSEQMVRMALIRPFLGFATRYLRFLDLDRPGRLTAEPGEEVA